MSASVSRIEARKNDSTGALITTVYAKVDGTYAVYRTSERVVVHFADDPALGADQRLALAPLAPLRGEINGLVDGWRGADMRERKGAFDRLRRYLEHDKGAKAELFDRRVADALIIALQGAPDHAATILAEVRADVLEERTSVARTEYVIVAAAVAVLVVGLAAVITGATAWADGISATTAGATRVATAVAPIGADAVGFAAAFGAVGALFSIALALRSRSLLTDLQSADNIIDATMRIFIGAISAVLLYCLLKAELVTFGLGAATDVSGALGAWQPMLVVVAFAAGFSERLVGDMLGRAALGGTVQGAAAPRAVPAAAAAVANERNPLGRQTGVAGGEATPVGAAVADDGDDGCDACHIAETANDDELTDDVELPEAVGGVARVAV